MTNLQGTDLARAIHSRLENLGRTDKLQRWKERKPRVNNEKRKVERTAQPWNKNNKFKEILEKNEKGRFACMSDTKGAVDR